MKLDLVTSTLPTHLSILLKYKSGKGTKLYDVYWTCPRQMTYGFVSDSGRSSILLFYVIVKILQFPFQDKAE